VAAKTLLSPRTTVSVRPWSLDLVVSRWLPVFPGDVFARGVVVAKTLLSPRTTVSVRPWSLDLVVSRRRAVPRDSVPFRICLLSRDEVGWVVSLRPSFQGQPFQYGLGVRWLYRGGPARALWSSKLDSRGELSFGDAHLGSWAQHTTRSHAQTKFSLARSLTYG
jgi:hypothetical protein